MTHAHFLEKSRDRKPQPGINKCLDNPCSTENCSLPNPKDNGPNGHSMDDRAESTNKQDRQEISQHLSCNTYIYHTKHDTIFPLQTAVPPTFQLSQLLNGILGLVHSLSASQVSTDETVNQDALIRGVTEGWHTLQYSYDHRCPLWNILQKLDEYIFSQRSVIFRLCLLCGAHMLLLVCITPSTYTCEGRSPADNLLVHGYSGNYGQSATLV